MLCLLVGWPMRESSSQYISSGVRVCARMHEREYIRVKESGWLCLSSNTRTHRQYSVNTGIDCDFWLLHKEHGFPAVHGKKPCKFKCLIFIGSPALTEVSACYIFGKCCKSEGKLSIAIPAIDMAVGRRCFLAPDSGIPLISLHHNYINIDRPLTIVTLLLIGGCQYCVSPNKTYSFITCKLLDKSLWKEYWTRPGLLSWEGCCCDRDFHHLAACVYVCNYGLLD